MPFLDGVRMCWQEYCRMLGKETYISEYLTLKYCISSLSYYTLERGENDHVLAALLDTFLEQKTKYWNAIYKILANILLILPKHFD